MEDNDSKAKRIRRRHASMAKYREYWESDWKVISGFVNPRREWTGPGQGDQRPGNRRGNKVYDGTPGGALRLLADGLLGYLVSPNMRWFRLRMPDPRIEDMPGVRIWLQECERLMYSEIERTNFYHMAHQYFMDGGSIGTATMFIEDDLATNMVNYRTIHPNESYILEDQYGVIDTVHRMFDMTVREAVKMFGANKLSEKVQRMAKVIEHLDTKIKILHVVMPNEDRKFGLLTAQGKAFYSAYLEWDVGEADKDTILREGGYETNPYAVWRWRTNTGEMYGRSPAHDALVDIQRLNTMSKDLLHAANLAVNPAVAHPENLQGKLNIGPGGRVALKNMAEMPKALVSGITYPIGIDREDKLQAVIEKHFRVEFFLMLSRDQRPKTATEVVEWQGEKAAVMGATIGQIERECLDQSIDRQFRIMYAGGRLPEVPAVVLEQGGTALDIDYMGPLAQAQRRLWRTQGINLALERLIPLKEVYEPILDVVDFDELAREMMDADGMPAKLIKPRDVVAKTREEKAKAMQEQQQMQQMQEMAKAVPNLNQQVKEGSMLEQANAQGGA